MHFPASAFAIFMNLSSRLEWSQRQILSTMVLIIESYFKHYYRPHLTEEVAHHLMLAWRKHICFRILPKVSFHPVEVPLLAVAVAHITFSAATFASFSSQPQLSSWLQDVVKPFHHVPASAPSVLSPFH